MSEAARGALSSPHTPGPPGRRPTHSQREIGEALGIGSSTACEWIRSGLITGCEPLEELRERREELIEQRRVLASEKMRAANVARREKGARRRREEVERREAERLTRAEMAEVLGVNVSTIRRWVTTGQVSPDATRAELEELAERRRQELEAKAGRAFGPRQAAGVGEGCGAGGAPGAVDRGEIKVRRITPEDVARLEAGRERRLPLSDIREVAA